MARLVAPLPCLWLALPGAALAIEIASPLSGATVKTGDTVTVAIAPEAGETLGKITAAFVGGLAVAAPVGNPSAEVPVPLGAVGPAVIVASAEVGSGEIDIAFVQVRVDAGPLRRLSLAAPPLMTQVGQILPLQVTGIFEDGVRRDLTLPERGTVYTSSNESVVGVHESGIVQARSRGKAQIRAVNGSKSSTAVVNVVVPDPPDNGIPRADAGPDQKVAPQTLVDLSGTASSDPDGDALRFRWGQQAGRAVILRDAGTDAPYFVAPRVAEGEQEVLEFSLVVEDVRGARSFPDVVTITVTPQARGGS